MKSSLMLLFGGIVYILYLIYQSFTFAKDMVFLHFHITALGLVFFLLGALSLFFYVLFLYKPDLFCAPRNMWKVFALHVFVSVSLLYTGEYFYTLALQFLFVMSLLRSKQIILYAYLLFIFIALLLIFVSYPFVYFLAFLATIYFILSREIFFQLYEIQRFAILSLCCGVVYWYMQEFVYQVYIWSDIVDKAHSMSSEIFFMLSVLQILTLSFIIKKYKDMNLFKKK